MSFVITRKSQHHRHHISFIKRHLTNLLHCCFVKCSACENFPRLHLVFKLRSLESRVSSKSLCKSSPTPNATANTFPNPKPKDQLQEINLICKASWLALDEALCLISQIYIKRKLRAVNEGARVGESSERRILIDIVDVNMIITPSLPDSCLTLFEHPRLCHPVESYEYENRENSPLSSQWTAQTRSSIFKAS